MPKAVEASPVPFNVLVVELPSPVSLTLAVLVPEPPLTVKTAAMPDSVPVLAGAFEDTLIVSLPPPALMLAAARSPGR